MRFILEEWISTKFFYHCLDERSEGYSHKDTSKRFRFFPVRDIPLRFNSLNLIFLAPNGRIYPIFVETLQRVHDLSNSKIPAAEISFGELLAKKVQFSDFLEGKGYFLSPVFTVSLKTRIFLHKSMERLTGLKWHFFTKIFFGSVFVKKSWNFWIILKQIRQSLLPATFHNFHAHFLQTHLQDSFAYCLTVLTRS